MNTLVGSPLHLGTPTPLPTATVMSLYKYAPPTPSPNTPSPQPPPQLSALGITNGGKLASPSHPPSGPAIPNRAVMGGGWMGM